MHQFKIFLGKISLNFERGQALFLLKEPITYSEVDFLFYTEFGVNRIYGDRLMIMGILAVLCVPASAGMSIAILLLIIRLLRSDLWFEVPLLSIVPPPILLGILTSWSLF